MSQDANEKVKATNLFNVNGRTAVIRGGGSGLGSYMARALALNGASSVFILGRRLPCLESVASSVSTGSIGAFDHRPLVNLSYGPSKAGWAHMTQKLATTLVSYDIRANVVAPSL